MDAVITVPQTSLDVGVMLSKTHASEKLKNREYVFQVFHNIRFLARQGIALRGDGDEKDSNFMQLLMLCKINNPKIQSMLEKKTDKYTSPIIQNEMLQIMGLKILRDIADSLQKAKYFSLMADKVTDTSNREQVAICIRWVDSDFQPHEEFIGLHKADTITAIELVTILKDVLLRMNLNITIVAKFMKLILGTGKTTPILVSPATGNRGAVPANVLFLLCLYISFSVCCGLTLLLQME